MNQQNPHVPSWQEYKQTLNRISGDTRLVVVVRMGAEMGMSPMEIGHALKEYIDFKHERSLYIHKAKAVKRKGRMVERRRTVPIHSGFYPLLRAYAFGHDQDYIIHKRKGAGQPMTTTYIEQLYRRNDISWTPHKGRYIFKQHMKEILLPKGMWDETECRKLMGHIPRDSAERYDPPNFSLSMKMVETAFGGE